MCFFSLTKEATGTFTSYIFSSFKPEKSTDASNSNVNHDDVKTLMKFFKTNPPVYGLK